MDGFWKSGKPDSGAMRAPFQMKRLAKVNTCSSSNDNVDESVLQRLKRRKIHRDIVIHTKEQPGTEYPTYLFSRRSRNKYPSGKYPSKVFIQTLWLGVFSATSTELHTQLGYTWPCVSTPSACESSPTIRCGRFFEMKYSSFPSKCRTTCVTMRYL